MVRMWCQASLTTDALVALVRNEVGKLDATVALGEVRAALTACWPRRLVRRAL
ncbi:MAG: hypothetical protein ACRENP_28190 [Longimicrobiales bacterium]